MKIFKIYAGLGGGFGGAVYQCTSEYDSREDAEEDAYYIALEAFEEMMGYHGLVSLSEIHNEILEDWDDYDETDEDQESEFNEMVSDAIASHADSWIDYRVEETDSLDNDDSE